MFCIGTAQSTTRCHGSAARFQRSNPARRYNIATERRALVPACRQAVTALGDSRIIQYPA